MKIGRRSAGQVALRGDIRRVQSLLSRPMTGHTLRKLPFSRNLPLHRSAHAGIPFARSDIILHTRRNVKNFFGVFYKSFSENLYTITEPVPPQYIGTELLSLQDVGTSIACPPRHSSGCGKKSGIYSVAIASNRSAKRSCQMPGARCQGRYLSNCHLKDETECLQTGTIIMISFHFTYRRYVKYRPWPLATGNWLLNRYEIG